MIANYHTHTPRCRHAEGAEEEYVLRAIDGGLNILGFSDHTPYFFPGDYYSHMRMYPQELAAYVDDVNRLKEKYAGKLQIHLGLEVEYYPALFGDLLPVIRDAGIEYMILGQHWPGNEIDEPYNGRPTDLEEPLERYCNQVIEALETGLFTYLAHPDLIHFVGKPDIYDKHMSRLCQAAKKTQIPLEINLLGLRTGRQYPNPRFWQIAGAVGCQAVLGSDAHRPQDTVDPETEALARQLAAQNGLALLETVPLIKL